MPVTWEIRDSVLIVAAIGSYATFELTGAIQAAMSDPRFGPQTSVLFDARSSLAYLSDADIRRRTEWFAAVRRDGLFPYIAFVAPADLYRVRMVELGVIALHDLGIEAQVFTDPDAALRWLTAPR